MIAAMSDTATADITSSKTWNVHCRLDKFESEASFDEGTPDDVLEFDDNLLLNAGITRLITLLVGGGGQAYDLTHSRIGTGISNTAAASGQTDLQGATKYYKLVDSVTPSGQTITWVATFPSGQGNYAWEEWGIDNGTADNATAVPPMLNRRVVSMGTKASGAVWVFTVAITIA